MNRPLFFTVIVFALGEVFYMIAEKSTREGIFLCMLSCCAFFVIKIKKHRKMCIFYTIAMILGFLRAMAYEEQGIYKSLYGGDEGFRYIKEDNYTIEHYEGHTGGSVRVSGEAVVNNIEAGSTGYNITVKISGEGYKVIIYGVDCKYAMGDRLFVNGTLRGFDKATNPGSFDMRNYYLAKNIMGYMYGSESRLEVLENNRWIFGELYYKYKNMLFGFKARLSSNLYTILNQNEAALYEGILLGERDGISEEILLLYRINGISHILAISGLHISLMGSSLYKLLRRGRLGFVPAAFLSGFLVVSYGIMTGMSFATLRAVIMFGIFLGGQVLGRRGDTLTSMSVALGVITIASPYSLTDKGVLLSFGAITAVCCGNYILKLMERIKFIKKLRKKKRRIYGILSSVIYSLSVSIITAPIIADTYFQIPFYSFFVNLMVIPMMTIVVLSGIVGLVLSFVGLGLAEIAFAPGVLVLSLYELICSLFSKLPIGVINTGKPVMVEIVVYYSVVALFLLMINYRVRVKIRELIYKKKGKWIPYNILVKGFIIGFSIYFIAAVAILFAVKLTCKGEMVVFLDVGQGDGALIRTKGKSSMVIDCGSVTEEIGEYTMMQALLSTGMSKVDYWFVTHFDSDHISGLDYVIDYKEEYHIEIKNIVVAAYIVRDDSMNIILSKAKAGGINIIYMKPGDYVSDGSSIIRCIHPGDDFVTEDKNQASLVLDYSSEAFDLLLLGDVDTEVENMLAAGKYLKESYDIMKVAHHGSKYSICHELNEYISGGYGIISVGRDNLYGHPHQDTLNALEEAGINILRTDKSGAIYIR